MMSLVQCTLCPHACRMRDYERGRCRVRVNQEGKLYTLVYGKPCAVHVDPIEKKPMFHMYPGSGSFSIATAGCCLSCKYCQNWQISQAYPEETRNVDLAPEEVVAQAMSERCRSIAYTYSDPIIFYEYTYDTAVLAHQKGLANILVTCGFINTEPLKEIAPYIDGANVDLKGFSEEFYESVTGGRLGPVLDTLVAMKDSGILVEITNLIVPTLNDEPTMIRQMCRWIAQHMGRQTPLHFSRFYPQYQLQNLPPTPLHTLQSAREIAMDEGLHYVYIGNIDDVQAQQTYCESCGRVIVGRSGYRVTQYNLKGDACRFCNTKIHGLWYD
ncbi:MAG: AmmeMemoRadiSam system radical SAM enzyme [Candidatus Omnitrophica bacterium]|nr:AmmeMemoRadiSam system radical SAM enzyme [Candidatus Omnitrophota bacterium]